MAIFSGTDGSGPGGEMCDDPNGFRYDDASNTITVLGSACDALQASALPNLQVIFGCPADGGPPIIF